jgi:hypothetical protein
VPPSGDAPSGHALVDRGHSVFFIPAYSLVQELLAAKSALALPRALRKLDHFEVLLLDDLVYIRQSPEEAEVLFTLLAERYERSSSLIRLLIPTASSSSRSSVNPNLFTYHSRDLGRSETGRTMRLTLAICPVSSMHSRVRWLGSRHCARSMAKRIVKNCGPG